VEPEGFSPRAHLGRSHHWLCGLGEAVADRIDNEVLAASAREEVLAVGHALRGGLKFETFREKPSACAMSACVSRQAISVADTQVECPPST